MSETLSETTPQQKFGGFDNILVRYSGQEIASYTYSNRYWSDSRSGSQNPRWRQQVASGKQAGTGFSGERLVYTARPFYLQQDSFRTDGGTPSKYHMQYYLRYGTIHPDPLYGSVVDGLSEGLANNRAKEQLVRKIRKKQTTFQGGTFVGELLRTVALIRNPAKLLRRGLGDYINRLKRFGPKAARLPKRDVVRIVRDTWLEYQLGWAPLLSELDDGVRAIAESGVLEAPEWESVRAVGADEYVTHSKLLIGSSPHFEVTVVDKRSVVVRYISCVDVGTYSAWNARRMGFAPTNWLPTLWELVPYSFVVDYFTNIGDIISAATLAKSSVRWTIKTVRKSNEVSFVNWRPVARTPTSQYDYAITSSIPGTSKADRTHITREPYTGSLVPSLTFSLPSSSTQWLNIAALWDARRDLKRYYR